MNFNDWPIWVQLLVVLGASLGLLIAAQVFLIAPKTEEIVKLEGTVTKLRNDNNKAAALEAKLPEFEAEIRRLEEQFNVLVQILPTQKETEALVNSLKTLADSYNLHILSFKPSALVSKGIYSEYGMNIQLVGSYHSLAMFFEKVSKMERIVNIGGVKMKRGKKSKKGSTLSSPVGASFKAVTYVYQEKPNA